MRAALLKAKAKKNKYQKKNWKLFKMKTLMLVYPVMMRKDTPKI